MNSSDVLILPGWQNSGPDHWQSLWEARHGYTRVEQSDWMTPKRGDWMIRLEETLLARADAGQPPAILAAHSLGCILVAAWASHSRNTHLVRAALLVAPGDADQPGLAEQLPTWQPVSMQRLQFPTMVLNSTDDPYCTRDRAEAMANAWGARFVDYGQRGHINGESGLGHWEEGQAMLQALANA